ncbi:MAG: Holliday junction resolvase RuvX [Deltaproteobacteria bacterium]|nr:Holliday junction resolvase RuvX [Deltaproteobacteria bacterium]
MKRLAIDYGKRRAGIAITDDQGTIIIPYKIISYKNLDSFLAQIKNEIVNVKPGEIVLGLPLNMDGTESKMSREVRGIAKRLEKDVNIKTVLYDERLTTFEAREFLKEHGVSEKRQKEIVDMYAAYCLLKSYIAEQMERRDV